jgi:putative flippase GtrA
LIKHFFTKQFLGFVTVGCIAALLHWLSRIILSKWLSFSWAVAVAYAFGMLIAFTLNSFFIFPKSEKPRLRQARDFAIVNLLFFPLVWQSSITINHVLKSQGILCYTQAISHGIAVAIPMFVTFLIYKFITFKDIQYE